MICFPLEQKPKINAVGAAHSSLLRMWELEFFQPNTMDLVLIRQDLHLKTSWEAQNCSLCSRGMYPSNSAHQGDKIEIFQYSFL